MQSTKFDPVSTCEPAIGWRHRAIAELVMSKRLSLLCAIPLFLGAGAYAQPQEVRTLWDHNGSMMYLIENGPSREFYYQKPRAGMLEAGARPDSLLFRGEINDGQFSGTAYIFNAQCGQVAYEVKGPILDNGARVVLTGQAPRVGRNCQPYGNYTSTLEFRLLKASEVARPQPATPQTQGVQDPNSELPSSVAIEPMPSNPSTQSTPTTQTPTGEKPKATVQLSGVAEPNLPVSPSAQTRRPPSIQASKSQAGEPDQKEAPSAQSSPAGSDPTAPQGLMDKNLISPLIIGLNATLPVLSILFLVVVLKSNGVRHDNTTSAKENFM